MLPDNLFIILLLFILVLCCNKDSHAILTLYLPFE